MSGVYWSHTGERGYENEKRREKKEKSCCMKDFVEIRIITAARKLLGETVNGYFDNLEYQLPIIEFNNYANRYFVTPAIIITGCEQTEKERVIRLSAYSVTITCNIPETPESSLYAFAYLAGIRKAVAENPTLGGVVDRTVLTSERIVPPKVAGCGQEWQVFIGLRVTVEGYVYAG